MEAIQTETGAAVAPEAIETAEASGSAWLDDVAGPVVGFDMEIGGQVVEFDLERPRTWEDFERFGRQSVQAFAEGADRVSAMAFAITNAALDVRGLPGFEPRERDEAGAFVEPELKFRVRLGEYFKPAPHALVSLFLQFNSLAAPTVRRRTFR